VGLEWGWNVEWACLGLAQVLKEQGPCHEAPPTVKGMFLPILVCKFVSTLVTK